MTYSLTQIDGLTDGECLKLKAVGIRTTMKLLDATSSPKGRKAIAVKTGIPESKLLSWANRADYLRVKGMGKATAELIQAAGVTTVREFIHRNPERLAQAMAKANAERKLVRMLPTAKSVEQLIGRARKLPLKITY